MPPTSVKIPITKPLFGAEEFEAVRQPLASGWVVQGPFVERFERLFADFSGASHCCATSSCTSALHISVAALKLNPGDEVIVPAFTWISTANVVEYLGGRPVFCDIDLGTYNLDPHRVEACIGPRTVGLLPVHLFGLCAEMDPLLEIARRHGLWVVEDAACAFGARYRGKHAGTLGDVGCFSFHPRKSITTGEGGMFTTERADLDAVARSLRDHGSSRSDLDRHEGDGGFLLSSYDSLGYNYRMTDLQAALGCAQMARAQWILERRRQLAQRYDRLLADVGWLTTPFVPPHCDHGYQAYVTLYGHRTDDDTRQLHEKRNALMTALERRGISTRQGTHAPVLQGYYARKYSIPPTDFPVACLADRLTLALPLYPQMTESEQDLVVASLKEEGDRLV